MKRNQLFLAVLVFSLTGWGSSLLSDDPVSSISLNPEEQQQVDQGQLVLRELSHPELAGRTFKAIGIMDAPLTDVVQVITDYEAYPEFMPNVSLVDIHEQQADTSILNYYVSAPMGITKQYRIKIAASTVDQAQALVQWSQVEWPGLKASETIKYTQGYWLIEAQADSSSLVLYQVYSDLGPVPFGLGWIVDVLTKNSFPKVFLQTRLRAEGMQE